MAVAENLAAVQARIGEAARAAGRDPDEIKLMPVTKYRSVEEIQVVLDAGYRMVGENRLQELAEKCERLPDARFAMIGNVQRNKAKLVAEHAAELHSLDSIDLAANLERRLLSAGRRLPVLVQVNTSDEPQKSGIVPSEAVRFARHLCEFSAVNVQGLMTMAMHSEDREAVERCFVRLRETQAVLRDEVPELSWDQLSMGMSGDFELAIAHGATIVRVGTAIFGPRPA